MNDPKEAASVEVVANENGAFANGALFERVLEISIRLGILVLLASWCFQIVHPFIVPFMWGIILATAGYPRYLWLRTRLGGKKKLSATVFTFMLFVIYIVPTALLSEVLIGSLRGLAAALKSGALRIPHPPGSVADWPIVGRPVAQLWEKAATDLAGAARSYQPQLEAAGRWLLSNVAGAGLALLQFAIAIVIAGVLLARDETNLRIVNALAARLGGHQGTDFVGTAASTVRSVIRGVLGVALIQSVLCGMGFFAVGLPSAGAWALICLILAVVQIGIFPVVVPVVIYVFSTASTLTAVAFLIWCILVGALDNILKPILLGRGVRVPLMVIFVGAIGGLLAWGMIGLFLGSVGLVVGYRLFETWLHVELEQPTG